MADQAASGLLGATLALLLAGCAIAPEGTNLDRMYRSLYHTDNPEYGRPVTQAERRADFTGTHPTISGVAKAAWERDVEACDREAVSTASLRARLDEMWACLWAKGWRWDTDARRRRSRLWPSEERHPWTRPPRSSKAAACNCLTARPIRD